MATNTFEENFNEMKLSNAEVIDKLMNDIFSAGYSSGYDDGFEAGKERAQMLTEQPMLRGDILESINIT